VEDLRVLQHCGIRQMKMTHRLARRSVRFLFGMVCFRLSGDPNFRRGVTKVCWGEGEGRNGGRRRDDSISDLIRIPRPLGNPNFRGGEPEVCQGRGEGMGTEEDGDTRKVLICFVSPSLRQPKLSGRRNESLLGGRGHVGDGRETERRCNSGFISYPPPPGDPNFQDTVQTPHLRGRSAQVGAASGFGTTNIRKGLCREGREVFRIPLPGPPAPPSPPQRFLPLGAPPRRAASPGYGGDGSDEETVDNGEMIRFLI